MISFPYRLPGLSGRPIRGGMLGAVTAACLLTLAGCGGSSGVSGPQVASLPTTGAASAATRQAAAGQSTAASTQGPQERLDDTPQQDAAYIQSWDACLVAHGAHYTTQQAGAKSSTGVVAEQVADPIPQAASAACVDKLPRLPPELVSGTNPDYVTDWKAEVACMRSHGVLVHLVSDTSGGDPDGLAWTFDSATTSSPADLDQIQSECQVAAFSGKR